MQGPWVDQHFELKPSGVVPGSALRPVNGETRLVEGGPVISYSDFFTRSAPGLSWEAAPRSTIALDSTTDDLAVLLDYRLLNDFETVLAFSKSPQGQTVADYRAAIRFDPLRQLSVRVGANGNDFLVTGQSAPRELKPWVSGDTLIGGATRFLIADVAYTFDFEGDAACHLRNLTRILKPEGPLTLSHFFATTSDAQLKELQRYLAIARPHTRLSTLRSNGPAFTGLPVCDLGALETCLTLNERTAAALKQWLMACPAPTDISLRGAPEACLVEGKLTLRPYP